VPLDVPFRELTEKQRAWVLAGEPEWVSWRKSWPGTWYGVARFFRWLETKAYKMHVRVLLSRYRAYTPCSVCKGARLKPEALLWRVGTKEDADRVLDPARRFRPAGTDFGDEGIAPPSRASPCTTSCFLARRAHARLLRRPAPSSAFGRRRRTSFSPRSSARLRYVQESAWVISRSTANRARSRRRGSVAFNLTTALGTSLVNTLFVLDEPSIGLHPRDMGRVIGVEQRLRDAGNSLVVVEHDPADHVRRRPHHGHGSRPRRARGEIVFFRHALTS